MREILLLATLPGPRRRTILAGRPWRVVSTSPWLASQLQRAGIPHRAAESYVARLDWDVIHTAAARRLRQLRRHAIGVDPAWLDDWSHLLVDEVRTATFWELVARGIVARERPQCAHVQRVSTACGAAPAVAALASALAALGIPCRPW